MVRLRVKRPFFDREAGVYRASGQEFEASGARARVIVAAGVAEIVAVVPDASEPSPPEPGPAPQDEPEQAAPEPRGRGGRRRKG